MHEKSDGDAIMGQACMMPPWQACNPPGARPSVSARSLPASTRRHTGAQYAEEVAQVRVPAYLASWGIVARRIAEERME